MMTMARRVGKKKEDLEAIWTANFSKEVIEKAIEALDHRKKNFEKEYITTDSIMEGCYTKICLGHPRGREQEIQILKFYSLYGDEPSNKEFLKSWGFGLREAAILRSSQCPNIVTYLGFFVVRSPQATESQLIIAMEHAHHGDLYPLVMSETKRSKLTEKLRSYIIRSVCTALVYIHQRGIIHRDVKPENILVNKEGVVKLADFELATREDGFDRNLCYGTDGFISPEVSQCVQDRSIRVTCKSDIWSLGIVCLDLVMGPQPFKDSQTSDAEEHRVTPPDTRNIPELSEGLREFVELCVQVDPAQRPTAAELLRQDILQECASSRDLKAFFQSNWIKRH